LQGLSYCKLLGWICRSTLLATWVTFTPCFVRFPLKSTKVVNTMNQETHQKTPCSWPAVVLNRRFNFNHSFENEQEGNVAEYAIAKSVPQHGGARQRDWGIAVELPMGPRGRAAHAAGGSGLTRNDAALARRTWLDREYDSNFEHRSPRKPRFHQHLSVMCSN
jgi:hypothetical protein